MIFTCSECGGDFDNTYRMGRCPHPFHDADLIRRLEFLRDFPAYNLKHEHEFSGVKVSHQHYVHKGVEWDEQLHRHPVIAGRCAAQPKPLYPKDGQGFAIVQREEEQ